MKRERSNKEKAELVRRIIEKIKEEGAQACIVMVDWGEEKQIQGGGVNDRTTIELLLEGGAEMFEGLVERNPSAKRGLDKLKKKLGLSGRILVSGGKRSGRRWEDDDDDDEREAMRLQLDHLDEFTCRSRETSKGRKWREDDD